MLPVPVIEASAATEATEAAAAGVPDLRLTPAPGPRARAVGAPAAPPCRYTGARSPRVLGALWLGAASERRGWAGACRVSARSWPGAARTRRRRRRSTGSLWRRRSSGARRMRVAGLHTNDRRLRRVGRRVDRDRGAVRCARTPVRCPVAPRILSGQLRPAATEQRDDSRKVHCPTDRPSRRTTRSACRRSRPCPSLRLR